MIKSELQELLGIWAAAIGPDKQGKPGEGVTIDFICAHEELKEEMAKVFGMGGHAVHIFCKLLGNAIMPEPIAEAAKKAQKVFSDMGPAEEKYTGYFHFLYGYLTYEVCGVEVFSKSIYQICKEKGKQALEEAVKEYDMCKAGSELNHEYYTFKPTYNKPIEYASDTPMQTPDTPILGR